MDFFLPGRRRTGGRSPLGVALLAAGALAWPGAAPAGIVEVAIGHYLAHVGDPRADYFHGALLTEHDLDDEQSYKHSSNRYIGETDKNLNELLLPAGFGDVVLLFEEDDALLETPTDARDPDDLSADDFIVLNPRDGTWRGLLFLEEWGDIRPGVYADLTGSYRNLIVVGEPPALAPIVLALTLAALAFARRRLATQASRR